MAQLFTKAEVRRIGRLIRLAVLLGAATLIIIAARSWTGAAYGVGKKVEQPIPFSHQQHIAEVGLACERCHATAATGANAGLPANAVCLDCHEELFRGTPGLQPLHVAEAAGRSVAWKPVSALPDFVRFHHGAHARAGVDCAQCHGEVAQMQDIAKAKSLTMDFCVDCHRDVTTDEVATGIQRVSAWRRDLTDCTVCHY